MQNCSGWIICNQNNGIYNFVLVWLCTCYDGSNKSLIMKNVLCFLFIALYTINAIGQIWVVAGNVVIVIEDFTCQVDCDRWGFVQNG